MVMSVAGSHFILTQCEAAYRLALKLRATRPPAQGCWPTGRARQGANTPLPLKRSSPASFKRLLGGATSSVTTNRQSSWPAKEQRPPRPTQSRFDDWWRGWEESLLTSPHCREQGQR